MNKTDLVEALANRTGQTKAATSEFLEALIEQVRASAKKGDDITLAGFGAFKSKKRAARNGRNPQTGDTIKIPAKKVMQFSTSGVFNACLNPAKK